jgi:hypothetical protein
MPVYQAVTVTDDLSGSRRQVLRAVGIGTTVALAGCSGSGGGDSSGETDSPTGTEPGTQNTPDQTRADTQTDTDSDTSTSNNTYPEQDSENLQAWLDDEVVREKENIVGLKLQLDDLEIPEFPNILERYNEGRQGQNVYEDLGELTDGNSQISYDEMLYVAANMDSPVGEAETIYFLIEKPELEGRMNAVINANDAPGGPDGGTGYVNGKYFAAGFPGNSDAVVEEQSEFFNGINAEYEDIVHAVDLGDAPYLEEALQ